MPAGESKKEDPTTFTGALDPAVSYTVGQAIGKPKKPNAFEPAGKQKDDPKKPNAGEPLISRKTTPRNPMRVSR